MDKAELVAYAELHQLPHTPETTETLLASPHLRAVWELAEAVACSGEGMWCIAQGIYFAVAGLPPFTEDHWGPHSPGSAEEWLTGYALGCQMRWMAGAKGPTLPEVLDGPPKTKETPEEWVALWRGENHD